MVVKSILVKFSHNLEVFGIETLAALSYPENYCFNINLGTFWLQNILIVGWAMILLKSQVGKHKITVLAVRVL